MLTVVTWLWKGSQWRFNEYKAEHVNALERMVKANLKIPHRFICITDMPEGINCEAFPLWHDFSKPQSPDLPNCWRRLKAFSEDARTIFGDRFVSLDLDCVILGDITPIFSRNEDFVIMKGDACFYNGSMWMMNTGARKQIWDDFDPDISPLLARQSLNRNGQRSYGSDQAWISMKLGDGEAVFDERDGIYQYRLIDPSYIPRNAKIVFFAGGQNPWTKNAFTELQNTYMEYM